MGKKEIKINDRLNNNKNLINNNDVRMTELEKGKKRWEELKTKLQVHIAEEAYSLVSQSKALWEIAKFNLYKHGGYVKFEEFLKDFKLAKSTTYEKIAIYNAIHENKINEEDVIKLGFVQTVRRLKETGVKKTRENPIKPLRFQLKTPQAYKYYKNNARFTSYFMEYVFNKDKQYLEKVLNDYKKEKE